VTNTYSEPELANGATTRWIVGGTICGASPLLTYSGPRCTARYQKKQCSPIMTEFLYLCPNCLSAAPMRQSRTQRHETTARREPGAWLSTPCAGDCGSVRAASSTIIRAYRHGLRAAEVEDRVRRARLKEPDLRHGTSSTYAQPKGENCCVSANSECLQRG
jgi:hypothetical protein